GYWRDKRIGRRMCMDNADRGLSKACNHVRLHAIWNGAFPFHLKVEREKYYMCGLMPLLDIFLLLKNYDQTTGNCIGKMDAHASFILLGKITLSFIVLYFPPY